MVQERGDTFHEEVAEPVRLDVGHPERVAVGVIGGAVVAGAQVRQGPQAVLLGGAEESSLTWAVSRRATASIGRRSAIALHTAPRVRRSRARVDMPADSSSGHGSTSVTRPWMPRVPRRRTA
ncbi:hypothetical protein GCM10027610_134430 [Dactylosporangium cerinum]